MLGNPAPDSFDVGKLLLSSLKLNSTDLRRSLWERRCVSSGFSKISKFSACEKSHLSCPAPGLYRGSSGRHICVCGQHLNMSKASVGVKEGKREIDATAERERQDGSLFFGTQSKKKKKKKRL